MISAIKSCIIVALLVITIDVRAATTDSLLQFSDLQYSGAFRLPNGNFGSPNAGFAYCCKALTFNPAQNSLFITSHDWDQFVGEISIPAVVNAPI